MRTWTDSEERQLAGLLSKGASCDEIAPLMGKTIDAVRNKAKRLAPSRSAPMRALARGAGRT